MSQKLKTKRWDRSRIFFILRSFRTINY